WLTDAEVVTTLAELFSITPDNIVLVQSIAELNEVAAVKVLCECTAAKGDFVMQLSIYVRDPRLEQLESLPLIEQFCEMLHCSCLIPDKSHNPYSMLLVWGRGKRQIAYLDPERLDEYEE